MSPLHAAVECASILAQLTPTDRYKVLSALKALLFITSPDLPMPPAQTPLPDEAWSNYSPPSSTLEDEFDGRKDVAASEPAAFDATNSAVVSCARLLSQRKVGVTSVDLAEEARTDRGYAGRVLRDMCRRGELKVRVPRTRPIVYVSSKPKPEVRT